MPPHATSATYFFVTDQRCVDRTASPEAAGAASATAQVKKLTWRKAAVKPPAR